MRAAALRSCSGLQSSARGIAIIGRPCPYSLHLTVGDRPKITASEPKLIASGIAIIEAVPALSATQAALVSGRSCSRESPRPSAHRQSHAAVTDQKTRRSGRKLTFDSLTELFARKQLAAIAPNGIPPLVGNKPVVCLPVSPRRPVQ